MANEYIADGIYRVSGLETTLKNGSWVSDAGTYLVTGQAKLASIPGAQPGDVAFTAGYTQIWQLDTDGTTWVELPKTAATTAAAAAATSATEAAASAAAATAVKNSIPQDYTTLSNDVVDLKSALSFIKPIATIDTTFATSVCNHAKVPVKVGYWGNNSDGSTLSEMEFTPSSTAGLYALEPIELKANTTYTTTDARVYLSYVYNKSTGVYSRYHTNTGYKTKIGTMTITPTTDSILYMTVPTANVNNTMVVNGSMPSQYVGFGVPIGDSVKIPNLSTKPNIITVKTDNSGDFSSVYAAVQSISDSGPNNEYEIHIYEGTYDVISEVFGTSEYSAVDGIVLPPYVHLIGKGNVDSVILSAEFPNTVSSSVSSAFSTINVDGTNRLENITFVAYNCRYACHDDDGNAEKSKGFKRTVKGCKFWHKGGYTDDGSVYKWCKAYGAGISDGCEMYFENCEFRTDTSISGNSAWSIHGHADVTVPSYVTFVNCVFKATNLDLCATANGLNDNVEEYIRFYGCTFTRSIGTGTNVQVNKEQFSSNGVWWNAWGVGNKNCYPGVGNYATGQESRLNFIANDNT